MSSLTNNTVASYNEYTFPVETITQGVSIKPIMDSSGRTTTHNVYTIKLKATIGEGDEQALTLEEIRSCLTRSGGELIYEGNGFGDISINTATGLKDLVWGPRPTMLEWRPLGGGQAADIIWQVEFAQVDCSGTHNAGVLEANYKLSFDVDYAGYTTRTHTGFVRIAQSKQGAYSGELKESAESYVDKFLPPTITGFQRESVRRDLDESKCRCDFTVIDKRLSAAYPPGVARMTASHTLANQDQRKFVRWQSTITASYEMVLGYTKSNAYKYFIELVLDRQKGEREQLTRDYGGASLFLLSWSMGEPQIFGRESAAFTCVYAWLLDRNKILRGFPTGGLWRPVPNTDFNKWAQSVSLIQPRGVDGLRHSPQEDVIVDLCLGSSNRSNGSNQAARQRANERRADSIFRELQKKLSIPEEISEAASWLGYECFVVVEPDDHAIEHVPLLSQEFTPLAGSGAKGGLAGPTSSPPNLVQYSAARTYVVRLVGRALRVGYQVPQPILESYGGKPVMPANGPEHKSFWAEGLVGYTTHPIYAAQWDLRWVVLRGQTPLGGTLTAEAPKNPSFPKDIKAAKK